MTYKEKAFSGSSSPCSRLYTRLYTSKQTHACAFFLSFFLSLFLSFLVSGIVTYGDGSTYEGEFVTGLICGRGEFKNADGRQYIGEWAENMREGRGEEIDAQGRKYVGLFRKDLRHGTGVWQWPSGRLYDGMWAMGQQHGWGRERIPVDIYGKVWTEYLGEFCAGAEKMGKGRFVSANGDVYDGAWNNKLRHGFGQLVAADGYAYEGEWCNDLKSGIGRETTTTGDTYQGEFHSDLRHGAGTEISVKGDQYIGEFFKGVRYGQGKLFENATSSRYEGEFVNDVQHGFGSLQHREVVEGQSTWITYQGEWRDGVKHGEGIEIDAKDLSESKANYVCGHRHPETSQSLLFRTPSLTLSATSRVESDSIDLLLRNLRHSIHDDDEREEWVWQLERGLSDSNDSCSTFRQQILEHDGVPVLCELLKNDTDDMAQLKGGQLLYFMSRTVNFSGMAAAIVNCPGAVGCIVDLLKEDSSEPRVYACGILQV